MNGPAREWLGATDAAATASEECPNPYAGLSLDEDERRIAESLGLETRDDLVCAAQNIMMYLDVLIEVQADVGAPKPSPDKGVEPSPNERS